MRVICHLDLDCFYCQVEHVRLQIPNDEPLAVQQWHSVIAVNYAARKAGVKRGMNVKEVKSLCATIHLIHVELIGNSDNESGEQQSKSNAGNTKVSLERYRRASESIMNIFQRFAPCERASIDEAYIDLSQLVDGDISNDGYDTDTSVDSDQLVTIDGSLLIKKRSYLSKQLGLYVACVLLYTMN
jgi:DNA polymerase eta